MCSLHIDNKLKTESPLRDIIITVTSKLQISDLGASSAKYNDDYFRIEGKARLPIRWMAWEAAILVSTPPLF